MGLKLVKSGPKRLQNGSQIGPKRFKKAQKTVLIWSKMGQKLVKRWSKKDIKRHKKALKRALKIGLPEVFALFHLLSLSSFIWKAAKTNRLLH